MNTLRRWVIRKLIGKDAVIANCRFDSEEGQAPSRVLFINFEINAVEQNYEYDDCLVEGVRELQANSVYIRERV
jgi:hypothetical protein